MRSLADLLWTIVRWVLPLTVAAVVVAFVLGSNRVGEEIRRRVEARLQAALPNLAVHIGGASLLEGEGIVVRRITIADPAQPSDRNTLIAIEEVRVACGTGLQDLLAGNPQITALRVVRPVVHARRSGDGGWNLSSLAAGRGGGGLTVPVAIEDATLLVDAEGVGGRLTLRNIGVNLRPAAGVDARSHWREHRTFHHRVRRRSHRLSVAAERIADRRHVNPHRNSDRHPYLQPR
jgi:hypothetical protein